METELEVISKAVITITHTRNRLDVHLAVEGDEGCVAESMGESAYSHLNKIIDIAKEKRRNNNAK